MKEFQLTFKVIQNAFFNHSDLLHGTLHFLNVTNEQTNKHAVFY